MASIREIAELTGLSIATVSHVINGTRKVSAKSTELVMNAIKETGYKPNYAARVLRTRRSDTVAMLIPNVRQGMPTNIFFMDVLSGAKDYLQSVGLNLIIATYSEEDENEEGDLRNLKVLRDQWIDGFLVVPNKKKTAIVKNIMDNNNPLVLLDRAVKGLDCSCVYNDTIKVSKEVVQILKEEGRKRIGYIGGSLESFTGYDRWKGYREGLTVCGMQYEEGIVSISEHHTVSNGYESAKRVIENSADSIYVSNDVQAIGVIKYLQEKNIKVPEEVAVIGFENYEWMEICTPALTTVCQEPYKMGKIGAQILHKMLENNEYKEEVALMPEIIFRDSHKRR